jgi:signal transduction histidine kinase
VTSHGQPYGYQDAILFEVYDTGIGISKENMQNLFKLFGKLNQTNSQINKEGIGLGLYIVKRMASQLGGTINVDSVQGQYTRFALTLPVRQCFRRFDPTATEAEFKI